MIGEWAQEAPVRGIQVSAWEEEYLSSGMGVKQEIEGEKRCRKFLKKGSQSEGKGQKE